MPEGIVHQPDASLAIRDDEAVGQRAHDGLDAELAFLHPGAQFALAQGELLERERGRAHGRATANQKGAGRLTFVQLAHHPLQLARRRDPVAPDAPPKADEKSERERKCEPAHASSAYSRKR